MKVCVYPRGEDDDIDDLFVKLVNRRSHGTLETAYTEDGTDGGGLDCSPDQTLDDVVGF